MRRMCITAILGCAVCHLGMESKGAHACPTGSTSWSWGAASWVSQPRAAIVRERPGVKLALLEKESGIARHQTGRNSGVLHSGIYYRPGSQKAAMCVAGRLSMERFCTEHDVPFEQCGKVIVAVDERELLGSINSKITCGRERCHLRSGSGPDDSASWSRTTAGIGGLHVPETGIVDYSRVAQALAGEVSASGA